MRRRSLSFGVCFPLAEYSISAAAIAIFSVGFAIIGTICVLFSFQKKRDYLLKPASMFYTFAGRRAAACPQHIAQHLDKSWVDGNTAKSARGVALSSQSQ